MAADEQRELAERLAQELRKLRLEDVLLQTLVTVSQIGYQRLGAMEKEERDLPQVELAIAAMQALTPVLERVLPAEVVRDFSASVASLQLAYVKASAESAAEQPPE